MRLPRWSSLLPSLLFAAVLAAGCESASGPEGIPGGPGSPELLLTRVPRYGSSDDLQGRALHVWPDSFRVAVYIRVRGAWWTKPYANSPATRISRDGRWTCDITTGGVDTEATAIAAFLLPHDHPPPVTLGTAALPTGLEAASVAKAEATRSP